MKILSKQELDDYRQKLAGLEEETRADGGSMNDCEPHIWQTFDPKAKIGQQVYASYSDEELLNLLIRTMDHPGRKPRFEEIHFIYRKYICLRFGGLNAAKAQARSRMKYLADQKKWPWDWSERVSPQPLLDRLERSGKTVAPEDQALLSRLCREACAAKRPPFISKAVHKQLDKLCGHKQALELMGIPFLNETALRHMVRYWNEEREKHQAEPCKETCAESE